VSGTVSLRLLHGDEILAEQAKNAGSTLTGGKSSNSKWPYRQDPGIMNRWRAGRKGTCPQLPRVRRPLAGVYWGETAPTPKRCRDKITGGILSYPHVSASTLRAQALPKAFFV